MSKVWIADRHIFQEKDGVQLFLYPKGAEVPWEIAVRLGLVVESKKVKVEEVENKAVASPNKSKGSTSSKKA